MTNEPTTLPLPDQTLPTAEAPPPRIRWAGIVWGAVIAALAVTALVTVAEGSRRQGINDWLRTLDPSTFNPGWVAAGVVLVVGVVLLITGGLALLRRAQRRSAAS